MSFYIHQDLCVSHTYYHTLKCLHGKFSLGDILSFTDTGENLKPKGIRPAWFQVQSHSSPYPSYLINAWEASVSIFERKHALSLTQREETKASGQEVSCPVTSRGTHCPIPSGETLLAWHSLSLLSFWRALLPSPSLLFSSQIWFPHGAWAQGMVFPSLPFLHPQHMSSMHTDPQRVPHQ